MKRCIIIGFIIASAFSACNSERNPLDTTIQGATTQRDGTYVRIIGTIESPTGIPDWYIFIDETGSINIEIEPSVWAGSPITPSDLPKLVQIVGEVEKDRGLNPLIEVEWFILWNQ